jgi:prepilin-type N-terminal cleavage/methylation domain-containing protein/prepilin-type processing-associated H-X9-DG protein
MRNRRGFTLIEMLIVIAIIGVLAAMLLPALSRSRDSAQRIACLNNLKQMATAAGLYATFNNGHYPLAYWMKMEDGEIVSYAWDFTTRKNLKTGTTSVEPGLLWQGSTNEKVQQCPAFRGSANWLEDPYTGYNYNTSYIGHGSGETIKKSARVSDVRSPSTCALFGDGEYGGGANKFMRSPLPAPGDASFSGRAAGTQGFRHNGLTNVVFCDGHAESLSDCYTHTTSGTVAEGTGFLSEDNRLYDLE